MSFASLHGHSVYSDGLGTPEEIVKFASECGVEAVGITDHGTMGGTYICFKPSLPVRAVAGIEAYHLDPKDGDNKKFYHITLLALNDNGYRLLCNGNYQAWRSKYRYPLFPVVSGYMSGVVCLTGCPQSYFAHLLRENRLGEAIEWVKQLQKCYDAVYVEIMGGAPVYDLYSRQAMDVARKLSVPVIATKDYHYCSVSDSAVHDALCVAKGRPPLEGVYALEQKPETIAGSEGIRNAIELAKRVQYTPWEFQKIHVDSKDDLFRLTIEKAQRLGAEYVERAKYEWQVIRELDMEWYICMLYYICQSLRDFGILYEARGSASGSLVCYLLGITCVDPIKYGLLFERFMSRSRREIPDIDLDIPASKRGELLSRIREKWNVAKMLTLNTVGEKMAVQCCRRVKERSGKDVDSSLLVGRVYNVGTHASGIVLWPKGTQAIVPVRYDGEEDVVECTMDTVPYVKWDCLGQKTLDVITDAYQCIVGDFSISAYHVWRDKIVDDAELLRKAMCYIYRTSTVGVFQLEGNIRSMLPRYPFLSLDDLAFLVALYRPAVLESGIADDIISGKPIDPIISQHCRMGYPIYQEDMMSILHRVVGFPLEDTYTIVKLAAKKEKSALDEIEKRILQHLSNDQERGRKIIEILRAYFGYGFNVAHAVAYAIRMAITAYFRYADDAKFMCVLLNREGNPVSRVGYQLYMQNVLGYRLEPSLCVGFEIEPERKRLKVGVNAIRHVSDEDAYKLSEIGSGHDMASFALHCVRKKVNRRTIKALCDSGVSSWFWGNNRLFEVYDAIEYNETHKKKKKPVPSSSPWCPRDADRHGMSVGEVSRYTKEAGVLLYSMPMPPLRVMSLSGNQFVIGAIYRQSSELSFVDPVGEVYKLYGKARESVLEFPVCIRARIGRSSIYEVSDESNQGEN